jgi:hypothetical protein
LSKIFLMMKKHSKKLQNWGIWKWKFNNSKVFKNTKNSWNFRKNASKIEKLYHFLFKNSKQKLFCLSKSLFKKLKNMKQKFCGKPEENMNERVFELNILKLVCWNFFIRVLCCIFVVHIVLWKYEIFEWFWFWLFRGFWGNFSGKSCLLIFNFRSKKLLCWVPKKILKVLMIFIATGGIFINSLNSNFSLGFERF